MNSLEERKDSISDLTVQSKRIGYYTGLTYGVGYFLTYLGVMLVFIEVLAHIPFDAWGDAPWLIASLFVQIIGAIFAFGFGFMVIKNAKKARDSEFRLEDLSPLVSVLSLMLLLQGVAYTILVAGINSTSSGANLSLFSPICGIIGPILFLVSFRIYQMQTKAQESKFIAAILMIVSLVLIYFISRNPLEMKYGYPPYYYYTRQMPVFIIPSPLISELTLEFITLLVALVCGIMFALKVVEDKIQRSITSIILSVSGIIFSAGLMYFTFSNASNIDDFLGNNAYISAATMSVSEINTRWILTIGFVILGIAGIIALIVSIISLVFAAKEVSMQMVTVKPKPEVAAPPAPTKEAAAPPPESVEVKYCPKCGAKMPKDAAYCPKCGQKQPKT